MLTGDGVVKILDFGIAKLAGEVGLTRVGAVLGTPGFMSPEQVRGGEADPRTDVWALGVVLYQMLAGRHPFPGEHGSVVFDAILHREPEPVTASRPEVRPELAAIVHRLLAKDPGGRYASAGEVAVALLAGPRPAAAQEPQRRPRPAWNPAVLWGGSLCTAGFLLFAAARQLAPGAAVTPQAAPIYSRLTEQEGSELDPSLSPDGSYFVYAKVDQGDLDLLLQRTGGSRPINLTADSAVDDSQPAFSPDGSHIAFRSEREGGGLFLMGATGESVRRLTTGGFNPAWSPSGREIAFATQPVRDPAGRGARSQIWVLDVASGRGQTDCRVSASEPGTCTDPCQSKGDCLRPEAPPALGVLRHQLRAALSAPAGAL